MKNCAELMPGIRTALMQGMQEFHREINEILDRQNIEASDLLREYGYDPKHVRFSASEIAGARWDLKMCTKCEAENTSPDDCKMHGYRPVIRLASQGDHVGIARARCPKHESAMLAKERRKIYDSLIGELPQKLRGKTFESFTLEGGSNVLQRARDAAVNAARTQSSVVLAGPTGTGKTHLAAAIVHHALKQGHTAILKTVPSLMDTFKEHFGESKRKEYFELLHCVVDADLLVLDDMGAEKQSQWCDEMLFKIIDARYLEDRQTVITTNYSTPDALVKRMGTNGQRIVSRLSEMGAWVTMDAPDWRTAKFVALRID